MKYQRKNVVPDKYVSYFSNIPNDAPEDEDDEDDEEDDDEEDEEDEEEEEDFPSTSVDDFFPSSLSLTAPSPGISLGKAIPRNPRNFVKRIVPFIKSENII